MSLIHDETGSKFALVESNSWSEKFFSTILQKFAPAVFPNHYCFEFETDLYYIGNKVRPDLILIEKDYRDWWLVEVELERHSWRSHIESQIEKILNAEIGITHFLKMEKYSSILDLSRLKSLMLNVSHKTLVVVDSEPKSWMNELQATDARLMTVQVFRNSENKHIIKCDTSLPVNGAPVVTYLSPSRETLVPNWLEIESPHRLHSGEATIVIKCDDRFFDCRLKEFGNKTYLVPPSKIQFLPLNPSNRLVLLSDDFVSPDRYFRYTLRGKVKENE